MKKGLGWGWQVGRTCWDRDLSQRKEPLLEDGFGVEMVEMC